MMYATTPLFLEYFGLRSLDELPAADELRRIPVQKPEALATIEEPSKSAAEGSPAPAGEQPAPGAAEQPAAAEETAPIVAADTETESSAVSPEPGDSSTTASTTPDTDLPR